MASQVRSWGQRWAAKENAHRLKRYDEALRRWQSDLELIRWALQEASIASPRPSRLNLKHGEELYWETTSAQLVELPGPLNLFSPVNSVYSPTRTNGGYAVLPLVAGATQDHGYAAVTNRRVIFFGIKANRDWAFKELTGIAHGISQPLTLFRVSSRERLSGLMFDGLTATSFQLFTALGHATYRNERAPFLAHLSHLEARHLARSPQLPVTVTPAEAPNQLSASLRLTARVFFGPSGASSARKFLPSIAGVFAFLLVCAAVTSPPKNPHQPAAPASPTGTVAATN